VISKTKNGQYCIKHEDVFEGPITLLFELIRGGKVDIYEIKLSYVINGFSDYIKEKSNVLLDSISSFIYFSSLLVEIKSRSLFPSKKKDEEKRGEMDVNILKRREEEYRTYRKVSNYLNSKMAEGFLFFVREAPMEKNLLNILSDFIKKFDTVELWLIANRLFAGSNISLDLDGIYDQRSSINIFDEMARITGVLSGMEEMTFKELSSVYSNVNDRIVSFLSLLELYKKEVIEIVQFENFGNIIVRSK